MMNNQLEMKVNLPPLNQSQLNSSNLNSNNSNNRVNNDTPTFESIKILGKKVLFFVIFYLKI